jgi:hypothetical protein
MFMEKRKSGLILNQLHSREAKTSPQLEPRRHRREILTVKHKLLTSDSQLG